MKQKEVRPAGSIPLNKIASDFGAGGKLLKRQWYLKSFNSSKIVTGADVGALGAWKITKGIRSIVVALIDEGFDLKHPDLNLPGKIVFPTRYSGKSQTAVFDNGTGTYHGTMCAGIAIAEGRSNTMLGVAPFCSFMPVSVPREASDDLMVEVFEQTALHADVISCSWSPPPIYAPLSAKLYKTLKRISKNGGPRKKGVVVCFSASNFNAPVNDPNNREFFWYDKQTDSIRITRGPILNGFAAHPGVIAVSASTSLNKKALYSNWGKEIGVCAPSNNYHPMVAKSPVTGQQGIWTISGLSDDDLSNARNKGYTKNFGGTSCSTALVAGVAALVLSANPQLTSAEVRKIIQETADKIEDRSPDMILGNQNGVYVNGHSEWFGYGKVNADAAVKRAMKMYSTKRRNNIL